MKMMQRALAAALVAGGLLSLAAQAQSPTRANAALQVPAAVESTLRKNLTERIPNVGKIDEVRGTPMQGIYEIRVGTELFYADAEGNYLLNGQMIDTRQKRNLTEERQEKLMAIDFDSLPVKDAFVVVRGNGKRKLAVFQDPNCGYCKRFERDLQKVDNVTVYMYLYPILGPDSIDKSRNIWCAKDKPKAWADWMLRNEAAPKAAENCDVTALQRNTEFGRKYNITGTPTLVFTNGSRVPGAIAAADLEKMLATK
jgi:thiol:disulfide interchange protein DsbC